MAGSFRAFLRRLSSLEIWFVGLAVAGSMADVRLLPAAAALIVVFWALRWLAGSVFGARTALDWGNAALILMLPVTLWVSPLPEVSVPQVLRLLTGIGLFYAIVNWASQDASPNPAGKDSAPRRIRQLAAVTVLAGLGLALFAAVSVEWAATKIPLVPLAVYERFTLLVQDTVHPNVLAGSLVILLSFSSGVMVFGVPGMRVIERVLGWAAVLLMAVFLALTQSRGAILTLGAVWVVLAALRWRWGWLAGLFAGAAIVLVIILLGSTTVLNAVFAGSALEGLEGRLEIWSRALFILRDFPFTGVGMGLYGRAADLFYPFSLAEAGKIPHAHNLFLQVGVDLGIPGLVAWLADFLVVFGAALQVYRQGRAQRVRWAVGIGAGLLLSQMALALHGMVDAVTWGMVRPAPIVWGLWGIAVASQRVFCRLSDRLPHAP